MHFNVNKILSLILLLILFSCSNETVKEEIIEIPEKRMGNFTFECIKNDDKESNYKAEMFFTIKNLNSSIHIDNLKKCYKNVLLDDFEKYSIPEEAFIAAKNESDIYYMTLSSDSEDIIIRKGTFYSEKYNVKFMDYKNIEFNDNGEIKM